MDKEHANRNVVDKLWAETSLEMKCEGEQTSIVCALPRFYFVLLKLQDLAHWWITVTCGHSI